ncbi:MAG: hypothetical protein WD016_13975 [Balneolaceae bacterium]
MDDSLILIPEEDADSAKNEKKFLDAIKPETKGDFLYEELLNPSPELDTVNKNIPSKNEIIIEVTVEPDYYINDERFLLQQKNGKIHLTHPIWSLSGMGENLIDAELDLISDAKIISDEYVNEADINLSEEALKLKVFLLQII